MANDNVTPADLKATAKAKASAAVDAVNDKLDNAQDSVEETLTDTVERVQALSTNQKLLLVAGGTLVASVVVQKIFERFRKPDVVIEEQIVNVVPTV